jgi:CheY-like chemotaxis protein
MKNSVFATAAVVATARAAHSTTRKIRDGVVLNMSCSFQTGRGETTSAQRIPKQGRPWCFAGVVPDFQARCFRDLRVNPLGSAAGMRHDMFVGISVLIVDDHPEFRAVARALLKAEGYEVAGEAADGASAIDAVAALRPSLVLLDIQLPDVDGFTVAERLAEADDPPAVVLISSRDSSSYRRRLARTSARGFISKSDLSGATLAALAC